MVRKAAVAGQFYEGKPGSLKQSIKNCFLHEAGPGKLPRDIERFNNKNIISIVSPHAGYIYSGPVAAHGFLELAKDRLEPPDTVFILGPNHRGGLPLATMKEGSWSTPLGKINIDNEIANELINKGEGIQHDEQSHRLEHSIEVQLPFLQYIYENDFDMIPICIAHRPFDRFKNCQIVGNALGEIISEHKEKDFLIIASTDFTHYEPHNIAKKKDSKAISAIEKLDGKLLFDTINRERITMCGVDPVTATIIASNKLGAKEAKLLKWASSGDITGDKSRVVGYGSLIIEK
ncbi:MAG: AmmeMemoRadiSam system protein B [Candidatus Lokiarchaeota archaeon]|nr:AmmeMemoRadiSam system protein B [Candidatus Lokiarchaeota archaeon]